ncbi:MAG: MarR family transcriptional regulator, partial [Lachnospiraceae bacterium]|nr:MarR family transcriptional regulator [Lachnospiraceae bacterium]
TLSLDAGTLTPLLKKLEKDGFITRTHSKDDERITLIKLTKKGDDLKEDCKDIPTKVSSILCNLTEDEIKTLYGLLYKII